MMKGYESVLHLQDVSGLEVTLTRKSSVLAAREMFIASWILLQPEFRVRLKANKGSQQIAIGHS